MLADTRLSTNIPYRILPQIGDLGNIVSIGSGGELFAEGDESQYLYVNLCGDIYIDNQPGPIWIGPGNFVGEIGFITGIRRLRNARAGRNGCELWRIHRSYLSTKEDAVTSTLMTHLLVGLAPHISIREAKVRNDYYLRLGSTDNYCDCKHHSIERVAHFLRGEDDWDSSINIWGFVREMPYRFGFWCQRASDTLQTGFGMCTTKANLQVALLRSLGIESQFGECLVSSEYVTAFLPSAFQPLIKNSIKHYFCVVKLDNQWFTCDASFSRDCIYLAAKASGISEWADQSNRSFERGVSFNYAPEEAFEYRMKYDLSDVMQKRPFYKLDNADVMNILLDEAQGESFKAVPLWVESVSELVNYAPGKAFYEAYGWMLLDTFKLYDTISGIDKRSRDEYRIKVAA